MTGMGGAGLNPFAVTDLVSDDEAPSTNRGRIFDVLRFWVFV